MSLFASLIYQRDLSPRGGVFDAERLDGPWFVHQQLSHGQWAVGNLLMPFKAPW
jgi:hypothetical protein